MEPASGKLEIGEVAVTALRREAAEEIGIRIAAEEPRMITTVHHRNTAGLSTCTSPR
jgi:8-oxo-dGTP diphosphatase